MKSTLGRRRRRNLESRGGRYRLDQLQVTRIGPGATSERNSGRRRDRVSPQSGKETVRLDLKLPVGLFDLADSMSAAGVQVPLTHPGGCSWTDDHAVVAGTNEARSTTILDLATADRAHQGIPRAQPIRCGCSVAGMACDATDEPPALNRSRAPEVVGHVVRT